MKKGVAIGVLAVGHFVATGVSLLSSLSYVMGRFETGATASSVERVMTGVLTVFFFPIGTVAVALGSRFFPGPLGWAPFLLNSALGAVALHFGFQIVRRRIAGTRASRQDVS